MAATLSKSIVVGLANDFSNVIGISYETPNVSLGVDIVDAFMHEYQQATLEDKKQTAAQTLEFIGKTLHTALARM